MAKAKKKKPASGNREAKKADAVDLKTLVGKIARENRYEEISVGPDRGKERVVWRSQST